MTGVAQATPLQRRTRLLGVVVVLFGVFLGALDQDIVSTALPSIVRGLGDFGLYGWVFTAYTIIATIAMPIGGRLSDRYGRRPLFLIGILIFAVGSALCATATSMPFLIGMRAIQGVGGGLLIALPPAILADMFSAADRGWAQGAVGGAFGLGSLVGPILGGYLTEYLSWNWVFLVNLPLCLIMIVITMWAVPGTKRDQDRGAEGEPGRRTQPTWRNGVLTVDLLLAFLIPAAMMGVIINVPVFLQEVQGMSPATSGLTMVPIVLFTILSNLVGGALMARTQRYRWQVVLSVGMITAAIWLVSGVQMDTARLSIVMYGCLFGAGMGLFLPANMLIAQNAVSHKDVGLATSLVTVCQNLGAAAGMAIVSTAVSRGQQQSGLLLQGMKAGFHIELLIAVAALLLALLALREIRLQDKLEV